MIDRKIHNLPRSNRHALTWLGGVATAIAVTLVGGVLLAIVAPGGSLLGRGPGDTARMVTATSSTSPAISPTAADTGPPFSQNMNPSAGLDHCTTWILDKPPAAVPLPDFKGAEVIERKDQELWAGQVGAVTNNVTISLTLQGKFGSSVILRDLEVRMVAKRKPLTPSYVYFLGEGCGGGLSPRYFDVDLDVSRPTLKPFPGSDEAGNEIPAVDFPLKIANNDPEVLIISAETEACDCTWIYVLHWLHEGLEGSTVIDDNGQPFRVATFTGKPSQYLARPDGWMKVNWS
jgi:hypothetical protein